MKTIKKLLTGISLIAALAKPMQAQVNDINAEAIKSFNKNSSYLRLNGSFNLPLDLKANGFVELYPDDFAFGDGYFSKFNLEKKVLGDFSAKAQAVTGTGMTDRMGLGISYGKLIDNAFVSAYWLPAWMDSDMKSVKNNDIIGYYAATDLLGFKLSSFGEVNLSGKNGAEWNYGEIDLEKPITDNISLAYNPVLRNVGEGRLTPKLEHRITLKYDMSTNNAEISELKGFVKTETDIQDTQTRKGVALQRTEVKAGPVRIKYDALTNLSKGEDQQNVGGIFLDNIVDNATTKAGFGVINLGNHDGRDETFWDAWAKTQVGDVTYGIEGGSSLRQTSEPRKFIIGTIQNVKLDNLTFTADYGIMTKNPLIGEDHTRTYAWIAANTDNVFASLGNEVHNTHFFHALTGLKDVGYLGWLKKDRETGVWSYKGRFGAGNVDTKFYTNQNMTDITRMFVVTSFYSIHLTPPPTKAEDFTFGVDLNGDNKTTTMRLMPGTQTPFGAIGVGTETKFANNESTTGAYASYYKTFSVAGINGSVEINYSGLTKSANGYVKLSKDL